MATQGMVSIIEKGKVICKIITGCKGQNTNKLAETLTKFNHYWTAKDVEYLSEISNRSCSKDDYGFKIMLGHLTLKTREVDFGCKDCVTFVAPQYIVDLDGNDDGFDAELLKLHSEHLQDPFFNSRWDIGLCGHIAIVYFERSQVFRGDGYQEKLVLRVFKENLTADD